MRKKGHGWPSPCLAAPDIPLPNLGEGDRRPMTILTDCSYGRWRALIELLVDHLEVRQDSHWLPTTDG